MLQNIFVTGTDTGVGKTHVTALLLAELRRRGVRAAAMKPIACGRDGRRDAEIYARSMGGEVAVDVLNPVYLRHPLAPSVAAKLERKRIDVGRIVKCYRQLAADYEVVLVEGAGGLMVPVRGNYFVASLARELGLPVLVVSRLGLGTINHTVLTVRQAEAEGLAVAGIVLNDTLGRAGLAEQTNPRVLAELCEVKVLGVVPHGRRKGAAAAGKICDVMWGKRQRRA